MVISCPDCKRAIVVKDFVEDGAIIIQCTCKTKYQVSIKKIKES